MKCIDGQMDNRMDAWNVLMDKLYDRMDIILNYTLGVLQADPGVIREHEHIYRLFCHECQRVFHDRLVDKTDKKYFYGILSEMSSKYFSKV